MKTISPQEISGNIFERIGRQWMLITAKDGGKVNTMTASWGGMGVLFEKPVAFVFIRPQRYTYEFVEKSGFLTLSFLPESRRDALNLCGKKSGRDCDKIAEAGLTLCEQDEYAFFGEAKMVLFCKKLYAQEFKQECFIADECLDRWYPNRDLHKMFVAEIMEVQVD